MKKIFKLTGIFTLLIFSFYYAFKINDVIMFQSSLMKKISVIENEYNTLPVNAIIDGDYIIPGMKGRSVDVLESYYNMKIFNVFNENNLVYEEVLPEISVMENKDKYISGGNELNRNIAIILDNNKYVEKYLEINNIKISILINYLEYNKDSIFEQINNDLNNFNKLDNILDNKICVINDTNLDICKKYKYYLIKPKIVVDNQNYLDVKNHLKSGQIFIISNNLSLDNFRTLYSEMIFKGYNIVSVGDIIKE